MSLLKKTQWVKTAIDQGILHDQTTAIGVMDFDGLAQTCKDLHAAFPPFFQHTFAVKANALTEVLKQLKDNGMGAEVASPGEYLAAVQAGFSADKIIFDSPAKTLADLTTCVAQDIAINIDNLQELARLDVLMAEYPNSQSVIGFRVNPQIGGGEISSTSTATATSKFGYALGDGDNREALINLYMARPWLTSIHTHSGSQGCPLPLMAEGIAAIVALAEDINARAGYQQVKRLDIGGGLPVNFASEDITPSFAAYAEVLQTNVPQLFSGDYTVKTEFGRAVAAKNGVILTRVEYTKVMGGRHIATTHAGAQIITRTAFLPQSWPIRVTGFLPNGELRTAMHSPIVTTDVAGPCCFAADLISKGVDLPQLQPNDYVMVHDTGAYYFSNHFDYNSLPRVAVYAAESDGEALSLRCIREGQTLESVIAAM